MTLKHSPRLLPPGQDLGATDEPVICDRWKNMVFDSTGKSHLCNPIYATEQAAKVVAEDAKAKAKTLTAEQLKTFVYHDGEPFNGVAYCLQIPWIRS
jgi:hypothetical protein